MHPFLFTLYCYVLEGNEIHISDFFVGMKYSISLLDLYLNTNLRVHQLNGIPVFIIDWSHISQELEVLDHHHKIALNGFLRL